MTVLTYEVSGALLDLPTRDSGPALSPHPNSPADLPSWLVFRLADQHFAIELSCVERVLAAAAVTPLPGAPPTVLGLLDLHGTAVVALDFRGGSHRLKLDDQFLIVRTSHGSVALLVDGTLGVVQGAAGQPLVSSLLPTDELRFAGVLRLDGGLTLVHDVDRFLSGQDADALACAMRKLS